MSLADLLPRLPAHRRDALERFLALGWPHRKLEAWHYTDLATLARQDWSQTDAPGDDLAAPPADVDAHDHFAWLNRALATAEPAITVAAGTQQHSHQSLRVAAGDAHTLSLSHGGQIDGLRSRWQHLDLAAGSRLQAVWISDGQGHGQDLARLSATLADGAELQLVIIHLGSVNSRLEVDVRLAGPGSTIQLHVLSLPQAGHFDLPFILRHAAPHAVSRAQVRAIGLAGTRASLNGRVVVHEGAIKTDSEQRMAALLLAPGAEINAKPDLEIYNDDVKCAHGASFGQLDPSALFYLQSRGLPRDEAYALLTQAFAAQVLDEVGDAALRDSLAARITGLMREPLP